MNYLPLSIESEDQFQLSLLPHQNSDHFSDPLPYLHIFCPEDHQDDLQYFKQKSMQESFAAQKKEKECVEIVEEVGCYLETGKKDYSSETRRDKVNRYLMKKEKRVWGKKINYVCRQNVAKERCRQKGRFVCKKQNEQIKRQRFNSTVSLESACLQDGDKI